MGVFKSIDDDLQEALADASTAVETQEAKIYCFDQCGDDVAGYHAQSSTGAFHRQFGYDFEPAFGGDGENDDPPANRFVLVVI